MEIFLGRLWNRQSGRMRLRAATAVDLTVLRRFSSSGHTRCSLNAFPFQLICLFSVSAFNNIFFFPFDMLHFIMMVPMCAFFLFFQSLELGIFGISGFEDWYLSVSLKNSHQLSFKFCPFIFFYLLLETPKYFLKIYLYFSSL